LVGVLARLRDHRWRHVDADHASVIPDLARRQETIEPAAAAEIEDGFPGL
jgi:hypothetical protein